MSHVIEFSANGHPVDSRGNVAELPAELVEAARAARNVEVFTGAGMSKDSGLDTFRDAQTGIWSRIDPQVMASLSS